MQGLYFLFERWLCQIMKLDEITVAFQTHDVFINSSDCFRFSERNHLRGA